MKRSHLMCSPSHFRREVRGWSVSCMRCLNLVAKDLMLICFFFYICFFYASSLSFISASCQTAFIRVFPDCLLLSASMPRSRPARYGVWHR